ncbi:MAG: hypothetical protein J4473_03930 [Candidatus Aenigmarchaeota archaeon]|nr:hypothetical protein [Candidatus Aenigmarchaeota archaeon]
MKWIGLDHFNNVAKDEGIMYTGATPWDILVSEIAGNEGMTNTQLMRMQLYPKGAFEKLEEGHV